MKTVDHNQSVRRGFTLLELLVVLAIVGILAALLLPVLHSVTGKAHTTACLSNLRQLSLGWKIYADENGGLLAVNLPAAQNEPSWVLANYAKPGQATNQAAIRQGVIYPYVRNASVYRCPADTASTNGAPIDLSYSMNGWMGSRMMNDAQGASSYRTFVRESEISVTGAAARLWVLCDEDHSTLDDGWFMVTMNDGHPFASFPGLRHRRGCGTLFADGHVDIIKLRDPSSIPGSQISYNNIDWLLLKQRTTEP